MDYFLHIFIMVNIYIILCVSTHLLVGMGNLISMGQAAFYGIGAYFSSFLLISCHFSFVPILIIISCINALFSLFISLPSLRLKGDYFVLASMGFQLITFTVLYNWISVTKGPYGISGIPSPIIWGSVKVEGIVGFVVLSSIIMILVTYLQYQLIYSPFGRILKALREDEITLISLGRNILYFKVFTFMLSAVFMAWGGFIYASYITYIDPSSFDLRESIFILAAVLIGGTGNIKGPILGAVFVIVLPEILRFIGLPDSIAASGRQIIYGMALIIFMRFRPKGIAGVFSFE